ncbi:MAG: hypothetical protein ACRDJO_03085 [Actinomycetota bacterium]
MDSHEHACQHHHSEAAAAPATCGGSGPCGGTASCASGADAHACGVDGQACAGALEMPMTQETVTLRANDLATLLDLVEAFAGSSYDEDGAFTRANEAFNAQAPELVAARDKLLAAIREMANRVSETRQN